MPLSPGKLRHIIEIQENKISKDSMGAVVNIWQTKWPAVYASIEFLSVREFIAAAAMESQVTARITIRYREGMDSTMRILHRGKIYNIAGILPDLLNGYEYLTIPVTEGVNEG